MRSPRRSGLAAARDQVQVAGSSTVLPYAKIVAETVRRDLRQLQDPGRRVRAARGAGIKQFCKGVGEDTIDIANSSRTIKDDELKSCAEHGVKDIEEVQIGYDGIVFATDIAGPDWALEPDGHLQGAGRPGRRRRQARRQSRTPSGTEVNPALPDWEIAAYIPGEKHGTREVFEEKLLDAGCDKDAPCKAAGVADDKAVAKACITVRKDGKAVDIDGDYTETLARIDSNKTGVGVFGLAFYENNADKLKVATVNGVVPSTETIAAGKYPVSRPLFFYVKKAHLGVIPGLKEYVEFFLVRPDDRPGRPARRVRPGCCSGRRARSAARRFRCRHDHVISYGRAAAHAPDGSALRRRASTAVSQLTGRILPVALGHVRCRSVCSLLCARCDRRGRLRHRRASARRSHDSGTVKPHSRPHYHGWWAFLLALCRPAAGRRLGPGCIRLSRPAHPRAAARQARRRCPIASQAPVARPGQEPRQRACASSMPRRAKLPPTFAELQPLLGTKGVALATDTQDYMIPIAVEANACRTGSALIGGIVALVLALAGALLRASARSSRAPGRATVSSG